MPQPTHENTVGPALASYSAAVGTTEISEGERVLAIVQRSALPWIADVAEHNFPLPTLYRPFSDPTTSHTFPDELDSIYATPLLYRLAFLKQLSLVSVTTHLDAHHTRLSHAIGVARLANRLLAVIRTHGLDTQGKELAEDPLYRRACLFYAFIHDAFHGPMGHTLDIMKDVFETGFTEKLDDHYLKIGLQEAIAGSDDFAGRQLRAAAQRCLPGRGPDLLRVVQQISSVTSLDNTAPHLWFFHDIVDSKLDADRIDYLVRDSRYLTESVDPALSIYQDIIDSARAVRVPFNHRGVQKEAVHLAYSSRFETEIAQILRVRRELYSKYYEATEKLIADDMLCHTVYYILRNKGITGSKEGAEKELQRRIIRLLLLLTDDELFGALAEMRADEICYSVLLRLRQHRFFRPVFSHGISVQDWGNVRDRTNAWRDTINKHGEEARTRPSERADILRQVAQESEPFVAEPGTLFVALRRWGIRGFLDRHQLERQIWGILSRLDSGGDARKRYVATEFGRADYITFETLDEYPPLHLTTTSFFDEQEFNRTSTEEHVGQEPPQTFLEWAKESSRPHDVLVYDDAGNIRSRVIPVDANPLLEFFPVVVSAPDTLISAFKADVWRDRWPQGDDLRAHQRVAAAVGGATSEPGTVPRDLFPVLLQLTDHATGEEVVTAAMFAALRDCTWLWKVLTDRNLMPA